MMAIIFSAIGSGLRKVIESSVFRNVRLIILGIFIAVFPLIIYYHSLLFFSNKTVPFLFIYWMGALMNFIVIGANGWKMPYVPEEDAEFESGLHRPANRKTRFKLLMDRFRINLGERVMLLSIGDIFAFIGAIGIMIGLWL